jgi:Zn-dependent metalloprotease
MHFCSKPFCCKPICFYIPAQVLDHLAKSEDPNVRRTAIGSFGLEYRTARRLIGELPGNITAALRLITGKERYVYNMNGNSDSLPGVLVLQESGAPVVGDPSINEAYEYSGLVYDFYKQVLGRDSLDNAGYPLRSSVHVGDPFGGPMSNAFWNGQQMAYGDGDGALFVRFTKALDVVAHELTHGVVKFTSDLVYSGESGALNESFADVMGALVVQWHRKQDVNTADWYMGGDVLGPKAKIKGIRTFKAEKAYENDSVFGTDSQPKHYRDLFTGRQDNGGVHINSGIPNHAFYLAAKQLGGYAWEKTGKIWYETMLALNPNSQFKDAASISYMIAGQLYGTNSSEQQAVKDAWDKVGLPIKT